MRPPSSLAAASSLALSLACGPRATPATPPRAAPASAKTPITSTTPSPPGVPEPSWDPEASCRSDGFDFVYTVIANGDMQELICGVGPGTPCQGESSRCDGANLLTCMYGKEGLTDCREACRVIGEPTGMTYDGGRCVRERGHPVCVCCDAGEPGCEHETPRPPSPMPESGVRLAKP